MNLSRFDPKTGEHADPDDLRFCYFITPLAAGIVAVGVSATAATVIATVATTAIIGAGIGAAGAAITGGDIGMGALMGGIAGGVTGGAGLAFSGAGAAGADAATTGATAAASDIPGAATTAGSDALTAAGDTSLSAPITDVSSQALDPVTGAPVGPLSGGATGAPAVGISGTAPTVTGLPTVADTGASGAGSATGGFNATGLASNNLSPAQVAAGASGAPSSSGLSNAVSTGIKAVGSMENGNGQQAAPSATSGYNATGLQSDNLTPAQVTAGTGSSSGGNWFSNLFSNNNGTSGGALNTVSNAASGKNQGINQTQIALGLLGGIGQALSKSSTPTTTNFSAMPGPSSTAATQGPLFNAPMSSTNTSGQPYVNRTPVNPLPSNQSYWTYGQGPEQNFFANNAVHLARGGPLSQAAHPGGQHMSEGAEPTFNTGGGQHQVRGPGDGTSDDVNAALSDGEYVLTAQDVARIGQGSNQAGAKKLDQFRSHLAKASGQKQFIPKKTDKVLGNFARSVAK